MPDWISVVPLTGHLGVDTTTPLNRVQRQPGARLGGTVNSRCGPARHDRPPAGRVPTDGTDAWQHLSGVGLLRTIRNRVHSAPPSSATAAGTPRSARDARRRPTRPEPGHAHARAHGNEWPHLEHTAQLRPARAAGGDSQRPAHRFVSRLASRPMPDRDPALSPGTAGLADAPAGSAWSTRPRCRGCSAVSEWRTLEVRAAIAGARKQTSAQGASTAWARRPGRRGADLALRRRDVSAPRCPDQRGGPPTQEVVIDCRLWLR